ncbi:MAG: hypothetical protein ACKVQW_15520 [Pyrinomonadaceae bacterium]
MHLKDLFEELYRSPHEPAVDALIERFPDIFVQDNWYPYGGSEGSFGVIENQQASPIPALIEKLTNSIDAVLMKRCLEEGIDPRSAEAPRSMEEAVARFFPDHKSWDLPSFRKKQAEDIQILADGPRLDTSLVIYDDGEGQRPDDFEDTFLSLLRGNKNEIPFVQGKYNMGGSGALIFCGKKRYQLIGSKRFDADKAFGFTLIRKHPLSDEEKGTRKNTWYEYLKIDKQIPRFDADEMDLDLHNRKFCSGTVIKLFSYDLPVGSRSVISRDLNRSLNEYLFEPALPIYTIDKKDRYPKDINLQRELHGLKRRLEEVGDKYIDDKSSITISDGRSGEMKVNFYLFKPIVENRTVKESRATIRQEFFLNNMSVLFSLNGQVHGHYTSEFITRSLKYPLFKEYLLIHVDCTNLNYDIRNELFMASRDRIKGGEESYQIREKLAEALRKSILDEWYKNRKDSISVSTGEADDLLRSFTKNLPLNSDLIQLLNQSFKLGQVQPKPNNTRSGTDKTAKRASTEVFRPQRFPSFLRLEKKNDGTTPIAQIPLGGERTLRFSTDVENEYLDRMEEPGELRVELLGIGSNDSEGRSALGTPKKIEDVFNVVKTSPHNGVVKIVLNPTGNVEVGDPVQIKVTLSGAGQDFEEIFFVQVSQKEEKAERKKQVSAEEPIGLPECVRVYESQRDGHKTWSELESNGIEFGYDVIMHPFAEDEKLEKIYINMDSSVLKRHRSKLAGGSEQYEIADKKYISAVYFHTLFLYTITRNRNYSLFQGEPEDVKDVTEYLKDLFQNHYASFLLNFGLDRLIDSLDN